MQETTVYTRVNGDRRSRI